MATILIADAQKEFRDVLQSVLTSYGHEVVAAETGTSALDLLKTVSPAVVILDLALPGAMPGIEVLAKFRAAAPALPVIVLTGYMPTDLESRARELGVVDVLRKGLKMDILMQAINHAFQHAGRPAVKPPQAASAEGGGGKKGEREAILVVDDEPEICDLVGEFLARRGYRVKTAGGGAQALEIIQKEPPTLVLLDIYMPGINGVEVLRRLKSANLLARLGVIMLTASQEEPLLQEALNLGAFDVLSKPVNLDELELAVAVKLALSAPE
jgi:CheY-like chemotaxis protein